MFKVTKTYGHDLGLSCCFRQWKADSHCHFFHGYALSFKLIFVADQLDERGWVIDFGSLKPIKQMLEKQFDHTMAIARDDPLLPDMLKIGDLGGCDLVVFEQGVGCERFAEQVGKDVLIWLVREQMFPRVNLESVECREHGANSAIWLSN